MTNSNTTIKITDGPDGEITVEKSRCPGFDIRLAIDLKGGRDEYLAAELTKKEAKAIADLLLSL